MQIKASLNRLHIAPRKVRLVAGLIRGLDLPRAELELKTLSKRSAAPMLKLLRSAAANARNNFQLEDPKDLFIKELIVNSGPMLKRFRPRAFGRAAMIRRKTSHISMVLETRETVVKKIVDRGGQPKTIGRSTEIKHEEPSKDKFGKPEKYAKNLPKPKQTKGFIKKVFQRKTI